MPKELILPEKKQEIVDFIKKNPTVNVKQLKEKYGITDGRILAGLTNVALAKIKTQFPEEYLRPSKQVIEKLKQEPKQEKEENMPLAEEEVRGLLEKVKATTIETIKAEREQEKRTEESLVKEKEAEETLSQINQLTQQIASLKTKTDETDGKIKTVCETYPELCKKVEDLVKKLETQPPASQKPEEIKEKGVLDTGHKTLDELLACPECLLGHIKKIGFDKAATEICKDNEACKAAIAELTKKGYEIGEPKKEEVINEPGKTKEEGGSGFTLGLGSLAE